MFFVFSRFKQFLIIDIRSNSFACEFEIKGRQPNCKGLEQRGWESHVHIETMRANTSKLHVNVVIIILVYKLEVFDWCFVHASIKIKHESLYLFVPLGRLVEEEHDSLCVVNLKLLLKWLIFVGRLPGGLLCVYVNHWQKYLHSTRTFGTQHVCLILDHTVLFSYLVRSLSLFRIFTCVENAELCSEEVASNLA